MQNRTRKKKPEKIPRYSKTQLRSGALGPERAPKSQCPPKRPAAVTAEDILLSIEKDES
ncbi:MAG: hypothetical protein GY868_02590 [Deltaproteobacteria bacterium]|nr:hypothetical protein [Deltaproteobacteria bacterium]